MTRNQGVIRSSVCEGSMANLCNSAVIRPVIRDRMIGKFYLHSEINASLSCRRETLCAVVAATGQQAPKDARDRCGKIRRRRRSRDNLRDNNCENSPRRALISSATSPDGQLIR